MKTNADEVKAKAVENRKKTTVIIDEINTKNKSPSEGTRQGASKGRSFFLVIKIFQNIF